MALHLKWFTFNPFSENTYVLYGDNKDCIIIDPGCSNEHEEQLLYSFIDEKQLNPSKLILTHAHIDHVLGVRFVTKKFNLKLAMHKNDLHVYESAGNIARMYGIPYNQGPEAEIIIDEKDVILIDGFTLSILHTPGHSPGSICLYSKENNFLIGGDVLFNGSIGRTDLPGGDFEILSHSIKTKLYCLPENTRVFSGHGESTTIGHEMHHNPFVKA